MGTSHSVVAMEPRDVEGVVAVEGPTRMDAEAVRGELARPWTRAWVVRERDEVAGYLVTWHVADELHVMNVATGPAHRRRGIGRALMDAAVDYARSHRIQHVLLEVRRSNRPAIALYRGLGFFAMGIRARYYPDDEDAVEMVLLFDVATGQIRTQADEVRV